MYKCKKNFRVYKVEGEGGREDYRKGERKEVEDDYRKRGTEGSKEKGREGEKGTHPLTVKSVIHQSISAVKISNNFHAIG
jgi:hypothetical protein